MTPRIKGLIVAAVQTFLVASLGAKLLYDRATRPRVWARAAPYDPDLPIRGRYVSLQLIVEARDIGGSAKSAKPQAPQAVRLAIDNDRLVAQPAGQGAGYDADLPHLRFIYRRNEQLAVLDQPVAFFIPEHLPDPAIRPDGEQLWVEVTIPRTGPPRPIQLGVKKGDGLIMPLDIQ